MRYRLLLLVPLVALIGWFVVEQYPDWTSSYPTWMQPAHPDAVPGACAALASLRLYAARVVGDTPALSRDQAATRAAALIAEQYPDAADPRLTDPVLVRGTFTGDQRSAWLSAAALSPRSEAELAQAAVIYLDADSGAPLALISAVGLDDPLTACGGGPVSRRVIVRQYLPLILAVGYTGLLLLIGGAAWLIRRRQPA